MKFNFMTLMVMGALFLFQFAYAKGELHSINANVNKRAAPLDHDVAKLEYLLEKRTVYKSATVVGLVKRCNGGGDHSLLGLDCLVSNVVDLLHELLGGDGLGDDEGVLSGLVEELVDLLHKLLGSLDLDLDLDGLLGGLLGHDHHFDDGNDFGCGCDGDNDALVSHLVELIEGLLDKLLNCDDDHHGLVPQLVKVVTHLLEGITGDHDHHHSKRSQAIEKRCDHHDDHSLLGLDCLLENVVDLVKSLLGDNGDCDGDSELGGLIEQLLKLVHRLLSCLDLGLDLDGILGHLLGGLHFDDGDDFGCNCDGDNDALVSHLVKLISSLLDELLGCDDHHHGLVPQLVKAVQGLLDSITHDHVEKRALIEKRCDHHGDGLLGLDCVLDTVIDLVKSILGGGDHSHSSDDAELDGLIEKLLAIVQRLLDVLGLDHEGGLLGGLLGGGHHHSDGDNDFGCGCDGDNDALVSHLVKLIEDLLEEILGCKDGHRGLVPQLVEAVKDLLQSLLHNHHHDDHDNDHHGGDHCDGGLLGLDCIVESVIDLVNSLLGGHDHDHDGVSDLIHEVLRVVRELLKLLNLDEALELDGLLGDHDHHGHDDFGCGCEGNDLIAHLVKTVDDLLKKLSDCDDDSGLITQLIKTVRALLKNVLHDHDHDLELRKRFQIKKRSTFGKRGGDGLLGNDLLCDLLEKIEDLLKDILHGCDGDDGLLEVVGDLVEKILDAVEKLLDCLTKNTLKDVLDLVTGLLQEIVNLVCELLGSLDGHHSDGLDGLLSQLIDLVQDLVKGCGLLNLVSLTGILAH